jgi:hypothetical protein
MFNFFKRSTAEQPQPKLDAHLDDQQVTAVDNKAENLAPDTKDSELNFNEMVFNLQEAMAIQAELGGKNLSVEDIFRISGMEPEELLTFLKGQELNIQAPGSDMITAIEQALTTFDEGQTKEGVMRKIANNNVVRSSFVALMLLAKFVPSAHGQEQPEKNSDLNQSRVETKADIKQDFNPDNTYQMTPAELGVDETDRKHIDAKPLESSLVEMGRGVQLDMANYFDTDSDFIPPSSEQAIKTDFENFLSKISPKNVEQILQMDFRLFGSSDERATSKWNGSNEELTTARLAAVEKILSETLQSYSFNNLPEDLAEQVRAKAFSQDMPFSVNGPEAGVTYIGDLLNPDTNQNYTTAEVNQIKNNNPDLYKQLLDDCRKITFSLETIKDDNLNKLVKKPPALETPEPGLKETPFPELNKIPDYKNVKLLFDNSPSINNSYSYMAEAIAKQNFDGLNIDLATFSNKLNRAKTYNNSLEVAEAINGMKFNGNTQELALSAAQEALKKMPPGEKNAVFIMTDEPFQDASWENISNLERLAAEKTTDVYFYYADDKNRVVRQISLEEIKQAAEIELLKMSEARVNYLINSTEAKIKLLDNKKNYQENRVAQLLDRELNITQQKVFQEAQVRAENLSKQISDYQEQLASLRADWESGSAEKLFNNSLVQAQYANSESRVAPNIRASKNISGENLGFEAVRLSAIEN